MAERKKLLFIIFAVLSCIIFMQGRPCCAESVADTSQGTKRSNHMTYDLVFEGGGAKGMAFVGAYHEFQKRGYTFERLLGTSAGAITALFIAAGYSPDEMSRALEEKIDGKSVFIGFLGEPPEVTPDDVQNSDIRHLLGDINMKFIPDWIENKLDDGIASYISRKSKGRNLFALVNHGGWYSADRFVTWLQSKLDTGDWKGEKRRFSHMTLAQFHEKTGVDLSVVASDTSAGCMLVLNHKTAPDCPVVWAVRMSMSIPLLWDEVVWRNEWGKYRGKDISGNVIVDGGMLSNFPIELFVSDEPQVTDLMGVNQNHKVLGWLIDESLSVDIPRGFLIDIKVDPNELKTVQRLTRLVDTMTGAHDKMVMEGFEQMIVRLPAKGYGTAEFDMSDERRIALVQSGQMAMASYLSKQNTKGEEYTQRGTYDPDYFRKAANRVANKMLRLSN